MWRPLGDRTNSRGGSLPGSRRPFGESRGVDGAGDVVVGATGPTARTGGVTVGVWPPGSGAATWR